MDGDRVVVKPGTRIALAIVPLAFAVVLVAWPLAAILRRGFAPDGTADIGALFDVIRSRRTRSVIRFTLVQATLSALITVVIGLPAAWSASRRWWGAGALRATVTAAFVLPTVVMALAYRSVFDRGLGAVLAAHAAFNVAIVVRVVGGAWARVDPSAEEAARTLGASRGRAWWSVTAVRLAPALASATLLAFLFSFTSFGVVLLVGDYRQGTIETEIFRLSRGLQFDRAGALALVQFLVVGMVVIANRRCGRAAASETWGNVTMRPRTARPAPAAAAALPALAVVAVPLLILVDHTLRPHGTLSLSAWRALRSADLPLAVRPIDSLGTSLQYAGVATIVALIVGGSAAAVLASTNSNGIRVLDGVLMLPLGVSAITLGYGYLITFDEAPLRLRASWIVVPLAHAAVAVPFVVRVLVPAMRDVDSSLRAAASTLGASRIEVWRTIDLPLIAPAVGVAVGFAAVISLGEFGATSMLARSGTPTAPFAIGQLLGVPGEIPRQAALGLALLLAATTTAIVMCADRFAPRSLRV
jgi:thiamine transport system permease protein